MWISKNVFGNNLAKYFEEYSNDQLDREYEVKPKKRKI